MLAMALTVACSQKEPGPTAPDPGPDSVFFNWLPSLLTDQSAAGSNHELMQFLDNPANYIDRNAMRAMMDRLGNAPNEYRENASRYSLADEPILDAIQVYIDEANQYLDGELDYLPLLLRDRG